MDLGTLLGMLNILSKTPAGQAAQDKVAGKYGYNTTSKKLQAGKKGIDKIRALDKLNQINSIKGKAKKSIAQYPLLLSENVSSKYATVLSHALEVEYAALVSMVIQNSATFDSKGDAGEVLGNFHNKKNGLVESTFLCGCSNINALYEASRELVKPYDENHNTRSLNEDYYTPSMMRYLSEAKYEDEKEARESEKHRRNEEDRNTKRQRDEEKYKQDKEKYEYEKSQRQTKEDREKARNKRENERDKRSREEYEQNKKRPGNKVLTNMKDIAKLNDIQPTILDLEVNFTDHDENSGKSYVITKQISIGVKCVSHLLKGEDIAYYLTKASYKGNPLLKVIKWSTGEISFWKDLVFALGEIKNNAVQNTKKGGTNYFSKLEFIAKQAKNIIIAGGKDSDIPTAITTLIISKEDVEQIKYKNGVNILSDPSYLKKIFNNFYLMNLLIVDESLEVVYSYDPDSNSIQRLPFSSYEKTSKERRIDANDLYKILK